MNKVILMGRIGQDPEIIQSGENKIAKFSLATNESYKDKNGQKVEQTEWHSIVVFGKQAEIAEKWFKKGNQLLVEGKIKTDSWEKDGEKKYKTNVILNGFEFIGTSHANDVDTRVTAEVQATYQKNKPEPTNEQPKSDDLPF
jgi:single-strand DNA-binding protein